MHAIFIYAEKLFLPVFAIIQIEPLGLKGIEMINRIDDLSPMKSARLAGTLYLILIGAGIFAQFFVRERLVVTGDPVATAANILASKGLFRAGFFSDMVMIVCDVALAWLFYVLLKPVNRNLAFLAVFFRLGMDAVLAVNMLNHFAALYVLGGTGYLTVLGVEQLKALSLFFLEVHRHGYLISQVFFGPYLFILGSLVYRSGFFPRLFGVLLVLAGCGYLIESLVMFLVPQLEVVTYPGLAVAGISELAFCLWLLIKGVGVIK